jgi:hypothetical protein
MSELRWVTRLHGTAPQGPRSLFFLGLAGSLACHDLSGLAGTQQLPSGTPNPSTYNTATGALALYQNAIVAFQFNAGGTAQSIGGTELQSQPGAFVDFVLQSGLLTDELRDGTIIGCTTSQCIPIGTGSEVSVDARQLQAGIGQATDNLYTELQGVRNDAIEGIGALATYDDSAPTALRGHLYALQGYAELLLADLFCSGIPLSTQVFGGDYTYRAGSSTDAVYQDAQTQFTTAIVLADSSDSTQIANLARIGQGRALLARGQYAAAALAVAFVPDTFTYQFSVAWGGSNSSALIGGYSSNFSVSDSEGGNGLPYITSGDPRTASQVAGINSNGAQLYNPVKYGGASPAELPIVVASGIEARLIQAEAALQVKDYGGWLTFLNRARAVAAPSLPLLNIDPGAGLSGAAADSVRVSMLFRERAFDLFLTGHRQGDLRRLIRQYGRQANQVYPSGHYPVPSVGDYGTDVTAPIPTAESANPLFHGCLSRSA